MCHSRRVDEHDKRNCDRILNGMGGRVCSVDDIVTQGRKVEVEEDGKERSIRGGDEGDTIRIGITVEPM